MTDKSENNKPDTEAKSAAKTSPAIGDKVARIGASKPARALKRAGYRIFRLAGELTALSLGLGFLWCYMMSTLLAQKSLDVSALEPNVAMWFTNAFDGRSADIGAMTLRWQPDDNSITLNISDIDVKDKNQVERNRIRNLQAAVDFGEAMRGRLKVRRVKIDGGAVTWKRLKDGEVISGMGTPETVGNFTTLPARERQQTRQPFSIGKLEGAVVTDTTVYVVDEVNGVDLQFRETDLTLSRMEDKFLLEVAALIPEEGAGADSQIIGRAVFSPDYEDFDLALSTVNLNPARIAPKAGQLSQVNRLNAPIDMTLDIKSSREAGLIGVTLDLDVGAGKASIGNTDINLKSFSLEGDYDPAVQILKLSDVNLQARKYAFTGTGKVTNIGRPAIGFFKQPHGFKADLSRVKLDMSHIFDAPFDLAALNVSGGYDPSNKTLVFNDLNAKFDDFGIETRLEIQRDIAGGIETIAGQGRVVGDISQRELLSLWPSEFALGARDWIDRAILKAVVQDVKFDFDLPKAALSGEPIDRDALTLSFNVRGGDVRYISTMTPYTQGVGSGVLRGNSFELDANYGKVGDLEVKKARVEIPRLNPKGGDLIIDIEGRGGVTEMLTLIDQEPFGFARLYGIDPKNFTGVGDVDLKLVRPLRVDFDRSEIQYGVSGQFTNVKVPFSVGAYQFEDGSLSMSADRTGIKVDGPINLGPWRANLEWQQPFSKTPEATSYKLSGLMDRATLDGFGIGLRKYFGGQFQVDIEAQGDGLSIGEAQLSADLTKSELRIGEYWSKEAGVAADLSGILRRSQEGVFSAQDVKLNAPGLDVAGQVAFAQDMRLLEFELTQAKVEGFLDGKVKIKPSSDLTAFDVNLDGAFLDISPFVAQAMAAPTKSGITLPLNLTANLDRLALNQGFILSGANLEISHNGVGTERAQIKGTAPKGAFLASIAPQDGKVGRVLTVDIPDASRAMSSFLNVNSLKGGRLQLSSQIPDVGETGPVIGTLLVDDFVLVNAPVFAQMLSLASLKGLSDAMGGAGLNFDELELPFSYEQGALSVRDGRASGAALGLTGSGEVDIGRQLVDINGVLVPAYTTNSALASIPVIGDIFVGKKGEGIFALSYSVRGPFKSTQVSVNPLSALTPGFLRRIFETERKALPTMQKPSSPDAAPGTADE